MASGMDSGLSQLQAQGAAASWSLPVPHAPTRPRPTARSGSPRILNLTHPNPCVAVLPLRQLLPGWRVI